MVAGQLPTTEDSEFNKPNRGEYFEQPDENGVEIYSSIEELLSKGITVDQIDQLFNELSEKTGDESGLKNQSADALYTRLEQGLARVAVQRGESNNLELVGYQSFIPIFQNEDIRAIGHVMAEPDSGIVEFTDELIESGAIPTIYETASAYTDPRFRGKGLNTHLKQELNTHIEQINGGGEMILRVGTAWNIVSIGLNTRNNGMVAVSGLSTPYAAELLWHMPYIRQDSDYNTVHFGLKTPDSKSKRWMGEEELNNLMAEVSSGKPDNKTRLTSEEKAVLLVSDVDKLVMFDQALRDLVEGLSDTDRSACLHSLRTNTPDTFFSILQLYAPGIPTEDHIKFKKHMLRNGTLGYLSERYPEVIGLMTLLGGVKKYHAHLIAFKGKI